MNQICDPGALRGGENLKLLERNHEQFNPQKIKVITTQDN